MKGFLKKYDQIRKNVEESGVLNGLERVICGLSGGADSVFLFFLLRDLAGARGFSLRACHVHHRIRGAEADRDADFSVKLAKRNGIPIRVFYRDVPSEAKRRGLTLEEAGREVRYACFLEMAADWDREAPSDEARPLALALAHHENDLAESVLFRLARGSGVHGLAPMRLRTRGGNGLELIRPLLMTEKQEILEALRELGAGWVEDSSNQEDDAARNRIRHGILPLMARELNSAAVRHIAESAWAAAEASDFLKAEGERRAASCLEARGDALFVSEKLLLEMPAMQTEILRLAIRRQGGALKNIGSTHIRALLELMRREEGKALSLPAGLAARRVRGGILLGRALAATEDARRASPLPLVPGRSVCFENWRISAEFQRTWPDKPPEKRYTKTIDYGKMKDTLVVRSRREGDYLTVRRDGARKSLSDYFTDEKVPREARDHIPLVADGSEIVWVVGMRIGYRYRITEATNRVLALCASFEETAMQCTPQCGL